MRLRHVLVCLATTGGVAYAQPGATPPTEAPKPAPKQAPKPAPNKAPLDPYAQDPIGPTPAPAPAPAPPPPKPVDDPVLAEQVASSLVQRAQELYDARVFLDAKQLAVEALVKSPKGPAADQARFLIKSINQQLGITEPEDKPADQVDLTPIEDPTKGKDKIEVPPGEPARASRLTGGVHSALYVGLIGTTVGSFFDKEEPAGGAIPVGIGAGLAAGIYLPRVIDKLHWNDGQVRTMGAGSVWGGVVGGLFGDIGKTEGTTARQVLVGASIGSTLGGAGGALLARDNRYTPGDIALVDTLAGMGAVGGLTIGMLMQPVETEAYSLNSVLGVTGGVIVGLVAAPQTNTTPRRMARVAGCAALGGGLPFLLYAGIYNKDSHGDERAVGALSSVGLVAGAFVGFRLTRNMDVDKDVLPGGKKPAPDDAPASLLGRSSTGRWSLGTIALQPLNPQLSPQRGMALPLVGGAW